MQAWRNYLGTVHTDIL